MKPHVHAELIKQWADGEFKIERQTNNGNWIPCPFPTWIAEVNYRIKDPYAELKAAAADPTKQVRCGLGPWMDGGEYAWEWLDGPHHYEIRDKPKPKVKMWQWIVQRSDGSVFSTIDFYAKAPADFGTSAVIGKALWTEIEVDL